mmetsp:Transcript_35475/g.85590  ORF Transcript_35475/g.85590 Transcript_35475/m.85590 type:complete len:374 (-) Transcript_35475:365-1486(-)
MASLSKLFLGGFPEINDMSSLTSPSSSLAALIRFTRHTSLVTSGVTLGLPSRSPPIQLANLKGLAVSGRPCPSPMASFMVASSLRKNPGRLSQSTVSMTSVPRSASLCGDGLTLDTSSVCHIDAISRRNASSSRPFLYGVPVSRMESASFSIRWTRPCFSRRVRRFTCVGCAVSTISTVWLTSESYRSSLVVAPLPSAPSLKNWESTPAVESRFVSCSAPSMPSFPSLAESILSLRDRWCASAALATPRKWANARDITTSSSAPSFSTKSTMGANRAESFVSAARLTLAIPRNRSTFSRTSSPWWRAMASPRRAPMVRTSERSMASSYRFLSAEDTTVALPSIAASAFAEGKRVGSFSDEVSHARCCRCCCRW